jgi:aldose 1-epimerase
LEGKDIELITIRKNNTVVKLLNYGAAIAELLVPDREGIVENIVLSYQNMEDYIQNPPYFGVTLGRTSGRIEEGIFYLDGQRYQMDKNFGPNHCHGGATGFSYKIWIYKILETAKGTTVEFEYKSPVGEENYPGELDAKVIYTLAEDNVFTIEYKAAADKKTLCNLTNHSYFNLSGNYKRPVTDQFLRIDAKRFLELNRNSIPTGRILEVSGTPMDFNQVKTIGRDIKQDYEQLVVTKGYDHPWLLEGRENQIEMYDSISGRKMKISTTYPSVVVYSFNYPKNERLKYGRTAQKHDGICFETQYEPNGINHEGLHHAILEPRDCYYEKTEFRFSVE